VVSLFLCAAGKREAVKEVMRDLLYVPFSFEDGGTRVIYYAPESYEPREGIR
jgi:D-glycero-alpha-D-manno-heptose-7-phosphate kinase